ncbi:MAG: hypothetical protein M0R50_09115 [Candidatus Cloacimonetes bacterium]|jgi:hypothetical protein|nr:hypothetical protein [Candidatus Cloacimonadota bacterium]
MAKDLRSSLAKTRDIWLESDEGRRCCEGTPTGVFLRNRIETAFLAGATTTEAEANEKLTKVKEQIRLLIDSL